MFHCNPFVEFMETLARRIRRLNLRIFMLRDRLTRAQSDMQIAHICTAIDTTYRHVLLLAQEVDGEREQPGASK